MKFVTLLCGLLAVSAPCWAVPIDYTFNLTTPAGPGATLLVSSFEDAAVQIQLSALVGTVQIDTDGAGVISGVGDVLDIEGGDRLIITPQGFVGPFTFVSAIFGNVDTGGGNSGDEAIPYLDGVAGSTITLPAAFGVHAANLAFNSTVAFQNSDGNDDFRVRQIIIRGEAERTNPVVPEPSTWTLLGVGIAGLAWLRRRKG